MRLDEVVFACREPAVLVRFWAALLDGRPVDRSPAWSWVEPPGFPRLAFQAVPEPKAGKNRLHLDVEVGPSGIEQATSRAVELGGVPVGEVVEDAQGSFQVMTDPEGNEFCFVSG